MAAAQQDDSGGRRASSATIRATLIRAPVTLDGRLDEPFWAAADSIDDFRQREPLEGSPATERTVVKVAHDAEAIYIVVRCYDSDMHRSEEHTSELQSRGHLVCRLLLEKKKKKKNNKQKS